MNRYGICKRNCNQPHNKGVANHAETGIAARTHQPYQNTHVAGFKRIAARQYNEQLFNRRQYDRLHIKDKRHKIRNRDKRRADKDRNDRNKQQHFSGILPCIAVMLFAYFLSD